MERVWDEFTPPVPMLKHERVLLCFAVRPHVETLPRFSEAFKGGEIIPPLLWSLMHRVDKGLPSWQ